VIVHNCRVGIGVDIHPFGEDRALILGGVKVPFQKGLVGHSDADALIHAICDAILGALGKGDIGTHFPDTDPRFKGVSSLLLLEEVLKMMEKEGLHIINIDSTIICEQPKLAPFIPAMKDTLCTVLGKDALLNIKATRNEKMGFIGRGEGIACMAIVMLAR
jgi:2-C-methyl-D-erythritol 2,4-cyclodiphosphate synthase